MAEQGANSDANSKNSGKNRGRPFKKGEPTANPRGRGAKKAAVARADGWVNLITALGTSRDKRLAGSFEADRLTVAETEEFWRGNDIAARIIDTPIDEMWRKGFTLSIQDEQSTAAVKRTPQEKDPEGDDTRGDARSRRDAFPGQGAPPMLPQAPKAPPRAFERPNEEPKAIAEAITARLEELGAADKMHEAQSYAEAHGGGAVLIGLNDGRELWRPVNEKTIFKIHSLTTFDKGELRADRYYEDPREPKFGDPMTYRLSPRGVGTFTQVTIHESRLLTWSGVKVSRRQVVEQQGWGDSVLVRCLGAIRDFGQTWDGAAAVMQEFAQKTLKMGGLVELIALNDQRVVEARVAMLDLMASTFRTQVIDDMDDLQRTQTPISGLPEMLDRFCNRVAAAARMPVTLLMGQAPAGLNASGAADLEWWRARIEARQAKEVKPRAEKLIRYLMLERGGATKGKEPTNWSIEFCPLQESSAKEEAEIREIQSRTDKNYVDGTMLLPDEVTKSRFGGAKYSTDTKIDYDLRAEMEEVHASAEEDYRNEREAARAAAKTAPPVPGEGEAPPAKSGDEPTDDEAEG